MPGRLIAALLVVVCCTFGLLATPAAMSLSRAETAAKHARDRDHDRLPDAWERRHRLSTRHRSTYGDPDRDRLSNLREYRARTDPRRADTDGDGLSDRAELIRHHTDPRRADTDGDGASDGAEVRAGTDPRKRGSAPPPSPASAAPAGGSPAGGGSDPGGGTGGPPATCAKATPNVPDGPDPWGGCFPGPSNTGVPNGVALTSYTGPCTITADDTVIDGKTVTCDIEVQATRLVIRNSVIKGSVLQPEGATTSFTISDSVIDGNDPWGCVNCGVGYRNFTIQRTEIVGTNRGAFCQVTCLVEDSWIHDTNLEPVASNLAHASAVRVEQYATLRHNTLACDYPGPFPNDEIGCSADISGYPDFAPIHNNTIDSNLIAANNAGTGFCSYGGGTTGKPYSGDPANATYVVFRRNVFQRGANGKCGTYGPITDFLSNRTGNVWSGNVWDDRAAVKPG